MHDTGKNRLNFLNWYKSTWIDVKGSCMTSNYETLHIVDLMKNDAKIEHYPGFDFISDDI